MVILNRQKEVSDLLESERLGCAAVAFSKGPKHKQYEDRYSLFPLAKPVVKRQGRGEIFAVFDGIGSAPEGMHSAQHMCDAVLSYYAQPESCPSTWEGIRDLLFAANKEVFDWGFMPQTDRPLGGCAGSVIWIMNQKLFVFHTGDTVAVLIRERKATQLTRLHEMDGAIYRYFGLGPNLQIDVTNQTLKNYDRILLISDGITKAYHPAAAAAVVEEHGDDLKKAAEDLARRARTKGSQDDITVLLVEYDAYAE